MLINQMNKIKTKAQRRRWTGEEERRIGGPRSVCGRVRGQLPPAAGWTLVHLELGWQAEDSAHAGAMFSDPCSGGVLRKSSEVGRIQT